MRQLRPSSMTNAARRLVREFRDFSSPITPPAAVLLYHRVADLDSDAQLLAVKPRTFADHLEILNRYYAPARLTDVSRQRFAIPAKKRLVALTFDDGYTDNLHNAWPLLSAADIPATVFVATGQVGKQEEFWWDELDRILMAPPESSRTLQVLVGGRSYSWDLAEGADGSAEIDPCWHVLSKRPCSPHQAAYKELCDLLRPLETSEREGVIDSVREWAGVDNHGREENLALSRDELQKLVSDGLVEIGGHTITHPMLSRQRPAVQKEEIEEGKRLLESLVGRPISSFSYPYGYRGTYTVDTIGLVRRAGYSCACSNFEGTVRWGTDRFQLPRLLVRDWDAPEFERRLAALFAS